MQCFSIWYKGKDEKKISDLNPSPQVKVHLNLWDFSLKNDLWDFLKKNGNNTFPALDIGIEIQNILELEKVTLFIPVSYDEITIEDLSGKLHIPETNQLVFNMPCEFRSDDDCSRLFKDNMEFLLCPVHKPVNGKEEYETACYQEQGITCVTINCANITSLERYQKKNINNIYCRFRIFGTVLLDVLFNKIKRNSDWFLVSGHISRKIVDLRINRERDIDATLRKKMEGNSFELVSMQQVNFLIMEPVSNEILTTEGENMTSRIVESGWDDYIGGVPNIKKQLDDHNIMAYHWKQDEEQPKKSYSKMVRINEYQSTIIMVIVYIFIILLLGILGSVCGSIIFELFVKPCKAFLYFQDILSPIQNMLPQTQEGAPADLSSIGFAFLTMII